MKVRSLLFTAILTFAQAGHALGISDANSAAYKTQFQEKVLNGFVKTYGVESEFVGKNDVRIRYILLRNAKAKRSVTIVNGSGENYRKYFEIAYDFFNAGYSVFMLDNRGQGASGRMTKKPLHQYVDNFENFAEDLKYFHDYIVRFQTQGPRFLLGHSMGGCISTLYAEKYPEDFKAIALSAPMHSIKLEDKGEPVPEPLAMLALAWRNLMGGGEDLVKPEDDPLEDTFEENALTKSRARFQMGLDTILLQPSLRLTAPTNKWMHEALSNSIAVRTADWAHAAQVPILLLQAEKDEMILPFGQNEFCTNAPNCTLEVVKGSSHEIMQEIDSIRTPALERIIKFFDTQASIDSTK